MEDVAKTLVRVSTALVLMIILVLVASMNMMHVLQEHAATGPPALITDLVTLVFVHLDILVSFINLLKPSSFVTYHKGLTSKNSTWCLLCVECFVRISEQTATFALYIIN